jgi:hypothetical protein
MEIAWTYAYARTVGAQNSDLEAVDDLVEVLGLGLERGLGVELLGDRRVGLGVDLRLGELLGHVESRSCCERPDGSSSKGRLDESRSGASLDRDAGSNGCESTSGSEHCFFRTRRKKALEAVLLYFWILELLATTAFPS